MKIKTGKLRPRLDKDSHSSAHFKRHIFLTRRKLVFNPRHDFFSLDTVALRETCFCSIPRVAFSESQPLRARWAMPPHLV